MTATRFTRLGLGLLLAGALTACGSQGAGQRDPAPTGSQGSASAGDDASKDLTEAKTLTVVAHESFVLPDDLKQKFEKESGYTVTISAPGDGGELVNQLILTKDAPLGDVIYGIDNTFSSRAVSEGVIASYDSPVLPEDSKEYDVDALNPVNFGDVCLNADKNWFKAKGVAIPATLDDLTKPEYKDLLVVPNAASSSPGLAFLVATKGAKGEAYLDYWGKLKDNGVKVVPGWTEAYYTEFSAADGKGPRPLVLSYASSPAFTLTEDKKDTTTVALLETCFRQVEYAGVIKGAKNEVGARKFVDFLLSQDFQASIPSNMYMYPAVKDTKLPADWEKFAPLATKPIEVPAEEIDANRDTWIKEWTAKVIG